jgi:hypothetical protein
MVTGLMVAGGAVLFGACASVPPPAPTPAPAPASVVAPLAVPAPTGAAASGPTAGWLTPPEVPPPIRVPAGQVLIAHDHAVGAQVYACTRLHDGTLAFMLEAPDAKLFDANQSAAGTHGAGPSWVATDGSSVHGKKLAQADAPRPDAIPWLLVEATANDGGGLFSRVRYVQRVDTVGGKAPVAGCDVASLGAKARADYTADYYFFGALDPKAQP